MKITFQNKTHFHNELVKKTMFFFLLLRYMPNSSEAKVLHTDTEHEGNCDCVAVPASVVSCSVCQLTKELM